VTGVSPWLGTCYANSDFGAFYIPSIINPKREERRPEIAQALGFRTMPRACPSRREKKQA
jgi:hypothetical protein